MKRLLFFTLFTILGVSVFAQRHVISGYITDAASGERLINSNVYDQTSLKGTTSNNYGFYSLSLPEGQYKLVVSFIGYVPQTINVNLTSDYNLNVALELKSGELEEVTVIGNTINKVEETQMSMIDLPVQKVQKLPVILGEADVLKVMQLLPGVQAGTEGTSGIYVRGGGSDQNLFLLDGVPVYNAGHLLGFFSVFNPDAIKTVKLYKGGFPARFGGRLSSVVDLSMKDGNMKEMHGNFSIGLISSKLSLEGPIVKDKTSFIVSARRTYADVMAQPLIAYINRMESGQAKAWVFFHDYNLKLNHIFSERSRLYLSTYFGKDKASINYSDDWEYDNGEQTIHTKEKEEFGLAWGNTIASLRWNYLINQRLFSNTTLTYSRYLFNVETSYEEQNFTENTHSEDFFGYYSGIEDITAKFDFDYSPLPDHAIKFGLNLTNHHFTPGVMHINFDYFEKLDTTFGNNDIYANDLAAYLEDDISITRDLTLNIGAHLSWFNVEKTNYLRLQPRISMRYKGGENWALKASYSRMAQHIHLLATAGISMPTDLWLPVTKKYAPPISDQVALGGTINLPKGFNLTIESFYKTMNNLIEYKEGASFSGTSVNWEDKVESGKGWSYGTEVMLEKTIGKTTGWIGYTWSKSERQFEKLNFGKVFPYKYDRRHDLKLALTHEFGKNFDVGMSWVYGTGNAVSLAAMQYPEANFDLGNNWYGNSELPDYGGRNNYRMPAYHRMDVGMNFHKQKEHGIRTWSVSAYNAYNRQNPFYIFWETHYNETTSPNGGTNYRADRMALKQFSLFPIIPTVSYSFKF